MDPAKDEQEECQSSSESGWTMYLGSPVSHTFNSQHHDDDDDGDGNHDGYHHDAHDDDDGHDSEASDASSGPSNYHHPWMKGEGRVISHGSKHVHGEEVDDEKMKKKARAQSEQHVVAKKLGDGRRRKNQQQLAQKASSHVR